MAKAPDAFRTISEVSNEIGVAQHVLRFWETKFPQVKPVKRGGGRRYYRPDDIALLSAINRLLYSDGYTIKGVQKLLREQGAKAVAGGIEVRASEKTSPSPRSDDDGAQTADGGTDVAPDDPTLALGGGVDAAFLRDLGKIRDRLSAALESART